MGVGDSVLISTSVDRASHTWTPVGQPQSLLHEFWKKNGKISGNVSLGKEKTANMSMKTNKKKKAEENWNWKVE